VAIAGGVDLSLDPFELVGFARAGALARDEMRVYDRRPQGFWPGEGCGLLVLMREPDAVERGLRVYARIRGWGISSDGAGGISRPELPGQLLALRRAYASAGFGPETVACFEGHGTGTEVGDATELAALTQLLREHGASGDQPAAIGSIKANIGHTKAASGAAGLIKATLALQRQLLPPMPGFGTPHELVDDGAPLRVPSELAPWPQDRPLRAGVSSMGFGGINTHVVLDSPASRRRDGLSRSERTLARTPQDTELCLIAAESLAALRARVQALLPLARRISFAELGDLAARLAAEVAAGAEIAPVRAALVAARPEELHARLELLLARIDAVPSDSDVRSIEPERGVFLGVGVFEPRIGLLFPGQGAPVYPGLGALGAFLDGDPLAALHASAIAPAHEAGFAARGEIVDTALAQPAIVASSLASALLLERLGVEADVAVGHSLGEIAALAWSGALSPGAAVELASVRGRIMAQLGREDGAMASLAVGEDEARRLIASEPCVIAAANGPARTVIAGDEDAVQRVLEIAAARRIGGTRLAVSHAFHSPHVAACAPALAKKLAALPLDAPQRRIVSTRTGVAIEPDTDLRQHLVLQLTEPVRFDRAVTRAGEGLDLWIESGPGRMLGSLASEIGVVPVISVDCGGPAFRGLLGALAAAFALGARIDASRLFAHRLTKPFDPARELRFFANPCSAERDSPAAVDPRPAPGGPSPAEPVAGISALDVLRDLVAARCELPVAAIGRDDRFLSDLHLSSIAVSELAARAARALSRPPLVAPNEFADATLAELAAAIESEARVLASDSLVAGVDAWVRAFEVVTVPRPRARDAALGARRAGPWRWPSFLEPDDVFGRELAAALENDAGCDGVLVHFPARRAIAEWLPRLLEAARAALERLDARHFVLVHHGDASAALARTLHQEAHSLASRVIEVPEATPQDAVRWVLAEVRAASGYAEMRFDTGGGRFERRLRPLALDAGAAAALPLGPQDVLLVSGGGKGIGAECALALARESGCALGLIGRSTPDSDASLRENLSRIEAAGIRVAYAPADVCDPTAVGAAVSEIEARVGRVSGLLHAAGLNRPEGLATLELDEFEQTLAPKLLGLENLLARLDPTRLRCLVGFGSIIAELGLPGEAHYALANELLTRRIEAFAAEHPRTRCLALAWSIWSGVGMGERLGRVESLAAKNISAITPDSGIAWLERLLRCRETPVRVVVSGRFGHPPTLAPVEQELPVARFLERIREHTPRVELVSDVELSLESDPYLADHVYRGEPILPGVLGLEAFAQVALALASDECLPSFENVRFEHPVVLPTERKRTLRIAALASESSEDGAIRLALRTDASGFQLDHMSAEVRLAGRAEPDRAGLVPAPAPGVPAALEDAASLYGELFFHRGRFARVLRYHELHFDGCLADIACREEPFFGAFQPARLCLGDAGARDAAIHAIQACVPDRDLLPVAVRRISAGRLGGHTSLRLRAIERSRGAGRYEYDLDIAAPDGAILERWEGLVLQEVSGAARRATWPAPLLAPRLEELAAALWPGSRLRAAFLPDASTDASARALAAARGAPAQLRRRPDGRPELDGAGAVSASHSAGHTLAVCAELDPACDVEVVVSRREEIWRDMLGANRFDAAQQLASATGESFDASATRVWGALECARKLGLERETPIAFAGPLDGAALRLRVGRLAALSLSARLAGVDRPLVATLLLRSGDAGV